MIKKKLYFFAKKTDPRSILLKNKIKLQGVMSYKRSYISSGVDSIHTWSSLPEIAFLAKKWATELPIHLTKEKLHKPRPVANTKISPIKCPYFGFLESPIRMALMITSTSPSTEHSKMHNSLAKASALVQANASTTAGEIGRDTLSHMAPITQPVE